MPELTLLSETGKLTRQSLALVPTPTGTATHRPIPHIEVVNRLIEKLSLRRIDVVAEEYAVSKDGGNMFGVMELDQGIHGGRFALGIRNSHNKQFRLSIVVGMRVFVCSNLCFSGDFEAVVAKHTKHLDLSAALSVGIDSMQEQFEPMRQAVYNWRASHITQEFAKLQIYRAFVEEELDAPKHLAKDVHRLYFHPEQEEFDEPTLYSLNNAFTSAFKRLEPIPLYRATADFGRFFNTVGTGN